MPNAQAILQSKVEELRAELPRISFGYIGNCGPGFDERSWAVFLPHPGRVGTYSDSVAIGSTDKLSEAAANWDAIERRVRLLYPVCERVELLKLRDGHLCRLTGERAFSAQFSEPTFASLAEAEAWLVSYNYPYSVIAASDQRWNLLTPTEKIAEFDRYDR
jgi:hypothetical protein